MRCLHRLLGLKWQDKVPYSEILAHTKVPSMFALLSQRRLRWLGHTHRMDTNRVPRNLLYGQLATGTRPLGHPMLRYRDVCKRDMISCDIDAGKWEKTADDRTKWHSVVRSGMDVSESKRSVLAAEKKARREQAAPALPSDNAGIALECEKCGRACLSKIGLYSHSNSCKRSREA